MIFAGLFIVLIACSLVFAEEDTMEVAESRHGECLNDSHWRMFPLPLLDWIDVVPN